VHAPARTAGVPLGLERPAARDEPIIESALAVALALAVRLWCLPFLLIAWALLWAFILPMRAVAWLTRHAAPRVAEPRVR
jgi:hypothetical protein